jgi:hypothetical protein
MKKRLVKLFIAVATIMALSIPAGAAELHDAHQGLDCKGNAIRTLHFVNNQTGGDDMVQLWIVFDDGTAINAGDPDRSNRGTNHWFVNVIGDGHVELTNAYTTTQMGGTDPGPVDQVGPGKLVLSDGKCKSGSIFN